MSAQGKSSILGANGRQGIGQKTKIKSSLLQHLSPPWILLRKVAFPLSISDAHFLGRSAIQLVNDRVSGVCGGLKQSRTQRFFREHQPPRQCRHLCSASNLFLIVSTILKILFIRAVRIEQAVFELKSSKRNWIVERATSKFEHHERKIVHSRIVLEQLI
jgi:hypothetical protein